MNFLDTINSVWFLFLSLGTLGVALIGGWVRFEMIQKAGGKKDEDFEHRLLESQRALTKAVERIEKNATTIENLSVNIEWIKGSMTRMENTINTFVATHRPSAK